MRINNNSIFLIIISIVVSISIALFAYFLLIHFVVDVDLQKSHREISILNFFEQPHDRDILIMGSSFTNEGIDAYLIEDLLQERQINRSVYVVGMDAETPLSGVPMLDNLIASKPDVVVIGLSYRDLTNRTDVYDDRLALISQKISTDAEYLTLFNDSQIKLLSQSPSEHFFYKRKFIITSTFHLLRNILFTGENLTRGDKFATNFKDPWQYKTNWTEAEKIDVWKNNKTVFPISNDWNPQKKALLYTTKKLQQNNISIIIINMPITPYYSSKINESTRQNFSNFLNTTGVPWYNFERAYPSDFFIDTEHMNAEGRTDFSLKIAAILADYLKKGA